jgi:hypothetical protein
VRGGLLGETSDMEGYEGSAALEWWANRSTCLGIFGIRVTITAETDSWLAQATVARPFTAEEHEGFDFLMALDPVFTLRFDDDSTVMLHVTKQDQSSDLTLREFSPAP